MNEVINKISALSKLVRSASAVKAENNYLEFSTTDIKGAENLLATNGIEFTNYTENSFTIDLKTIETNTVIFLNDGKFRQRTNTDVEFLQKKNIAILIYKETFFYFDQSDIYNKKTFIGYKEVDTNFLISNTIEYLHFIKKLKDEDTFADYYNGSTNEIVIYTASKGIHKIKLPSIPISLDDSKPYYYIVESTLRRLLNEDFVIHFKNQLFKVIKQANESQIEAVFQHLEEISQEADNDYQLYLKNFSFEKFKNDLQKEKEKYFNSLREILNKILSQVIGVPVSIAATIFAINKVEEIFLLALIYIAFTIYVVFAIHFQRIYYKDVLEIECDGKKDFEKISKESGLADKTINLESKKITNRINTIKRTIIIFVFLILTLYFPLSIYIYNQYELINKAQILKLEEEKTKKKLFGKSQMPLPDNKNIPAKKR